MTEMTRDFSFGGPGTLVTTVSNRIPWLKPGDAEVILGFIRDSRTRVKKGFIFE